MSHVSPTDPNLLSIVGHYAECPECHTPACDPVPPRYPVTVRGVSPHALITPHVPTCIYLRKVREGGPA